MKNIPKYLMFLSFLISCNAWALEPLENYVAYSSSDGSRSIKISKNSGEAYFYDNTKKNYTPIDLGSVAEGVEFKEENGTLKIVLKFNSGETQTFDSEGKELTDRNSHNSTTADAEEESSGEPETSGTVSNSPIPESTATAIPISAFTPLPEDKIKDLIKKADECFEYPYNDPDKTPSKKAEGVKYLKEASVGGSGLADYELGIYFTSLGNSGNQPDESSILENLKYGFDCFKEGAERGNAGCYTNLGNNYDRLYDSQERTYLQWMELKDNKNYSDISKAKEYYAKAVELGDKEAIWFLKNINDDEIADKKEEEENKQEEEAQSFDLTASQNYSSIKVFSSPHVTAYDKSVLRDFSSKHPGQYLRYTKAIDDYYSNTGKHLVDSYFQLPNARKGGDQPTKDEFLVEFIVIKSVYFNAQKNYKNPLIRESKMPKTWEAAAQITKMCEELFKNKNASKLATTLEEEIFGPLISAQNEDYMDLMNGK